ncbi:hypothetical protein [Rhodococcus sp. H29-C3]|uniref:hypothetical protein n=1 Tax=Rhodococcus sp. H29-C3 TaxID=3046307 RepID=UPI0024BA2BAA|nr:hypothetical protein [Rhodococcus sp. H29-C3]MDJ0360690.1 hypothetical protein [Rhodococcus sp. H29-C3]
MSQTTIVTDRKSCSEQKNSLHEKPVITLKARTEILKLRRRIQTLEKRAAQGKASQDESNELYWRRAELDKLKPTEPKPGEWPAPPTD